MQKQERHFILFTRDAKWHRSGEVGASLLIRRTLAGWIGRREDSALNSGGQGRTTRYDTMESGDGKLKLPWLAQAIEMWRKAGVTSCRNRGRPAKLTFEKKGGSEAHRRDDSRQRAAGRWQFMREGLVAQLTKRSSYDIRKSTGSTAGSRNLAHGHEKVSFAWQSGSSK